MSKSARSAILTLCIVAIIAMIAAFAVLGVQSYQHEQSVSEISEMIWGGPAPSDAARENVSEMVYALGPHAVSDYATVLQQLNNPALYPLWKEMQANGKLDANGYASLSLSAVWHDDDSFAR